jgi:TPR repeat protein
MARPVELWACLAFAVVMPTTCPAKTLAEAFNEVRAKAERGDATAELNLGVMFLKAQGTPRDLDQALAWFRKSAEQGKPEAQSYLDWMYAYWNVTPNPTEAAKWAKAAAVQFKKAAELGDAWAQFNLACAYDNGDGVPKDEAEAVKWMRKAADQGLAFAENWLGAQYDMGYVGNNPKLGSVEAAKWFRKAADQGLSSAQWSLACDFRDGDGVVQDQAEAVKWFRRAAEQGEMSAPTYVGLAYQDGKGVKADPVEALAWFYVSPHLGEATGTPSPEACIAELEPTLSPQARKAAKKRSEEILQLIESNVAARVEAPHSPASSNGFCWGS